ncbi:hypothetical protein HYV79_04740 [Candidatus Woesearchaeota archaeon]|nr:hypothetical protein [Candidatus Woesearchaeota archaeon]
MEFFYEKRKIEQKLLDNTKKKLLELETLLKACNSHWGYEDPVYRFYHNSFKVYKLQDTTKRISDILQSLLPEREINSLFKQIIAEGTNKKFDLSHNNAWLLHTRPILEAFFHAKYFLEMAVKYASLEKPPETLPSGYAAYLYLFNLR